MKKRIFAAAALLALLLTAGCAPGPSGGGSASSAQELPEQSVQEEIEQPPADSSDGEASFPSGTLPAEEEPDAAPAGEDTSEPPAGQGPDGTPVCTISISCAAALSRREDLSPAAAEVVPEDGWILSPMDVALEEGESVFDLLKRVCRDNKVHMEFSTSPVYGTAYIEGLGNLYEFDCGDGSGWMYSVNGTFPNCGCSAYPLADGDRVEWVYTCDFGADVGGGYAGGQGEAA